ncbi:c-type cytochrome [Falsiroseomonas tokyonensis]|uniref:C-type cytochrome n=1 Tax=Falsiroseomonas tokyonensis TaxID=430521 RepID=A0ABV7BRK3_9PROT|nr:cytochrome C [Falsiroseomonas tokyonensis]MBU8537174.1 cytochrome C [Falsiroseomonas tokyonensis]
MSQPPRGPALPALLAAGALLLAACGEEAVPAELRVAGGDPARGRIAIAAHGCGACHVIPGIEGAVAWVGPPLMEWARRGYVAGRLPNAPQNLVAFLQNPQAVSPGSAMPALPLQQDEALDIAAYLYTLGQAPDVPPGQPLAQGEAGTRPEPRIRPRLDRPEGRPLGQ